ncbi:hypothetical protein BJ912DRAFT_969372 [Pholiota molesta]|nr:hypothetical protein BJ912DRAFT_969372 [Pholiota molesta]
MAPSDTEANGAVPSLDLSGSSLSPQQLAYVFGHVPWVEFNVTAKANLNAFTGNPAVRHVVQQVAQATVKDITDKLVKDLTNKFEQALQQAIADSTNAVAAHITDNMNQLFKGLQSDTKARPFTAFQRLQDGDGLDNDILNKDNINAPGMFNQGNQSIDAGGAPGDPAGPAGRAAGTPSFGTNSGNVINGGVSGTNSNSFNPNSNNDNNNADPATPNVPAGTPGGPTTPGGTVLNFSPSNSGNIIGGSVSGTNANSFNPNSNNNDNNGISPKTDPNPPPEIPKAALTTPDIATGTWIWTPEQPYASPPQAPRGFRKTMNIPPGKFVDSLIIDITCDNFETVYINGNCLGYGLDFRFPKRWSVSFPPTNKVAIAVYAANDPNSGNVAGLLAAAVAWNSAKFQGETFKTQTDASWKCTTAVPPKGFEMTNFNDRAWVAVRTIVPVPEPWTAIIKPTKTEAITGGFKTAQVNGIPDAPRAPLATPGPDVDGSTDL